MKKLYVGLNTSASELDGIIVTHEHIDHIQSVGNLSKKFDVPVYATSQTFDAMPKQSDKISDNNKIGINIDEKFSIGDIEILPFSIPHDAANPCGYNLFCNNKKISVATDVGHMTNDIIRHIDGSEFLLLEANYDPNVLMCTKYPFQLKTRIAGPTGHLSNHVAGQTINYLMKSGLKHAVLGHLSKESNFPELAYQTVMNELLAQNSSLENFKLSVASRNYPGKLISI